jgi:hypothetical protein
MATKRSKSVPPEQFDKENKVLELRRSGETWERIAQVVGYANASGAQKAYMRVVKRVQRDSVDQIRDLELDRLDRIQRAYWKPAIVDLDKRSAEVVLKVMDRRAKLLGLEAPQKVQAEVMTYDGNFDYNNDIERIIRLLDEVDQSKPLSLESGASETGATTSGL